MSGSAAKRLAEDVRVLLSTHPERDGAVQLARTLVQEKLAACVNVVPGATSVYRWQGEVREDAEALLVIKTAEANVGRLKHRLAELHPYEVPEIVVLPLAGGSGKYLEWVLAETGAA